MLVDEITVQVLFLDIDDCAGRPCQNGGVCTDRVNDFSCRCVAGFEGKRCEISKSINTQTEVSIRWIFGNNG